MLEELLIEQRLNAGARDLLMSQQGKESKHVSAEKLLSRRIAKLLRFDSRIPSEGVPMIFMGPAGSGKTVSVAKLAIRIRESLAVNVGLVSVEADTRNSAFHLATFANLSGFPFVGASGGRCALAEAVRKLDSCEVVLVDVAPGAERRLGEIDSERLLVLPATLSQESLVGTAFNYERFGVQRLVASHLDCCGYSGPLLEAFLEIAKPLAFFGTGTRVPHDIEPAAARRIARMLTRPVH